MLKNVFYAEVQASTSEEVPSFSKRIPGPEEKSFSGALLTLPVFVFDLQTWQDFWGQYSIDYQLASLTSTKHTAGEAFFVNFSFPLPLTSRALPT